MTIASSPFLSATFHLRRPPSPPPLPCIFKPPPSSSSSSSILFIRCCSSSLSSSMESEKKEKQRVVVCGGGVIGVCTAYFLAKRGTASVTLVEKSSIACAASGKAGGFLALDWCDGGPLSNLARASFDLHRSLSLEFDGPQSYGYRPVDTLGLSITEGDEASKKFTSTSIVPGWVDGPVRNPNTIGTIETTAQVHPQLFTRTLVSSAVENYGLEVVIGELDSVEVDEGGGRVKGVLLKQGRIIEADSVVLALGPWSSRLPLISSLFRIFGVKAHSIVLEPREPSAITPHALTLSYLQGGNREPLDPELEVYPRPTGEVYVCGMSSETEVPDDPEEIVGDPESIKVLKRMAGMGSSHLREGEANVKVEQACFLPCTDDSVPVIGELSSVKGCYVATGHNCWGILNGPATGAAMAELVLDGSSSIVDLTPFSPNRFLGTRRKH